MLVEISDNETIKEQVQSDPKITESLNDFRRIKHYFWVKESRMNQLNDVVIGE